MNQLYTNIYIHIYPLFFSFPLHLSHLRALFPVLYNRFSFVIYFICIIHVCVCVNTYTNPKLRIHPTPPFLLGISKFVLYICVSISALQVSSSVPFFLNSTYKQYYMIFASPSDLLYCITVSRSIHLTLFCSFLWRVIFHCTYVPHLLYPLLC